MNKMIASVLAAGMLLTAAAPVLAGNSGEERPRFERYPNPEAKGPFVRAVRVGELVMLSGQIGLRPDGTLPESFDEQSHQVMRNIKADLEAIGLGMSSVAKCTVMIDDMAKWGQFNAIYKDYFAPDALPARSAFGADGLAFGAVVEVECWAYDGRG